LELVRLAANKLKVSSLPKWFWQLPKLSWLALAGNDCSPEGADADGTTPIEKEAAVCNIDWTSLDIMEKLGEGASGVIYKAKWARTENTKTDSKDEEYVAVKLFKGGKTSDGLPEDEMKASEAAGSHNCSLKVLGRIVNAPGHQIGLVMQLISKEFANLGGPPSFESVTRDTFESGTTFSVQVILSILSGIASVCSHLHNKGITHGDVYAHNILFNSEGEPLLGDFGAASIHSKSLVYTESPSSGESCNNVCAAMECFEVRAFGCLIDDLITRVSDEAVDVSNDSLGKSSKSPTIECNVIASLRSLHASCINCEPRKRPTFADISECLAAMKSSQTTH
jgi:serine/threonine protein kinase